MAELKTKPTDQKAEEFLNTLENEQKRKDAFKLLNIMKEVTGEEPLMWGPSIIGFVLKVPQKLLIELKFADQYFP